MRGTSCPECSEPVDRDTEFCPRCGVYLDWDERGEVERQQPIAVPRPADPVDSPPVDAVHTVPGPAGAGAAAGASSTAVSALPPAGSDDLDGAVTTPLETVREEQDVGPAAAPSCPRCGTARTPGRRFCTKCALEFDPPTGPTVWAARPRRPEPWWRRLLGQGRSPRERAALRAYRRSLPLRFRVIRVLAVLLAAALVTGGVLAVRGDPLGWLQARWDDVQGNLEDVPVAEARLDPAVEAIPEFGPASAVDGDERSAWATRWTGDNEATECGTPQTAAGLLVTFDRVADVRELHVLPGLPEGDPVRGSQHRPSILEVRSAEGHCRTFPLADRGEVQVLELDPPMNTSSVRIDVVAVHPAEGDSDLVAISEVGFRQRPVH
ncbi:hypothetical protein ACI782_05795 [Geodermatophilus sp. SYSU D00703]